jgi:hypothetical protein
MVGAGDIARCRRGGDERTAGLADSILRLERARGRAALIFTLGDHAYRHGSEEEFRACYGASWGRSRAMLDATRPAIGNHDYASGDAAGYVRYFGDRAGPPGRWFYSYDHGSWHVIVLNTEVIVDESRSSAGQAAAQEAWLIEDLRAHGGARCAMAYGHRPRFSSGDDGSDTALSRVWRILYDGGVDVMLAGHDHDYERFEPQTPDGQLDTARGIVQFVVGTGGGARTLFRRRAAPHSVSRVGGRWGVLKLELGAEAYRWEFVATDGRLYDSGVAACH